MGGDGAQRGDRRNVLAEPARLAGGVIGKSLALEIAPVITAIVVSARSGSAMAAELGSMTVTEQVDALKTMAVSPTQYLVLPRILATMLMMPIVRPWKLPSTLSTLALPSAMPFFSYPHLRASLIAVSTASAPVFIGSTMSNPNISVSFFANGPRPDE